MRFPICAAVAAAAIAIPAFVQAAPDGAMLGRPCAGCHGPDGNSRGPATPGLAGIDPQYFVETMDAFRQGRRPATIMDRIARGYTGEEVAAMATYFAGQIPRTPAQPFDAALAQQGATLHQRFCDKCHGNGGRDTEDSGRLAGQPLPYLRWSLEEFADGRRRMPREMRKRFETVYMRHGDEGLAALADFYAREGGVP